MAPALPGFDPHAPREERIKQLERITASDLTAIQGGTFLAHALQGYLGPDSSDYVALVLDPPARVRVTGGETDVWNDRTWLDTLWDVEVVQPHPDIPAGSRLWTDGISYSLDGKSQESGLVGVARPSRN